MFEILTTTATVNRIPFELSKLINWHYTNDYVIRLFGIGNWTWSDEVGNTYTWTNRNLGKETGTRVWRSTEPFTKETLPLEPLMTLGVGVETFSDPDAPRGSHYYYMLEVYKGRDSEFSDLFEGVALGTNLGPGPTVLKAGVPGHGFFGELPVADFITGDALATKIGLTTGTALNPTAPWLKFSLDGKVLYVSRSSLRHSVSWDSLHALGCVFGTKTVDIAGETYKVRLLKGITADTLVGTTSGYDIESTHGSEWNRLMYHVAKGNGGTDIFASEPNAPGDWAQYTDAELAVTTGNGRYQWCQETGTTAANRVFRGLSGVSVMLQGTSSYSSALCGWRACLELVP